MTRDEALATLVVVGPLTPGTCNAWLESAGRRCGKSETQPYLCGRHVTVALRRAEVAAEKGAQAAAKRASWRAENVPKMRAELDRVRAEIQRLDPPSVAPLDHGVLNVPLRKRMLSDSKVARLADLHRRREHLEAIVGRCHE
jgi:CDGSH-type Zn-finger protein